VRKVRVFKWLLFVEGIVIDQMQNIHSNVDGEQLHSKTIFKMLKARGGLQSLVDWIGALELFLSL
jgi:hypothetical protein